MMTTIALFLAYMCAVAVLIEFYKKAIRGYKNENGELKTKAGKAEIIAEALGLSFIGACAMTLTNDLGIGWKSLIVWLILIFSFQWLVDVKVVKKAVNAMISRNGEKL